MGEAVSEQGEQTGDGAASNHFSGLRGRGCPSHLVPGDGDKWVVAQSV